ncbi:Reticulon-like protein B3 [Glycine soja]|nr:hypothetical protein JHK86_004727 [Glycine max]KHN05214.1 Reticulon-like protein B3 [Glycine soja]
MVPFGIKALAYYVHNKGLKLGIYSDVGSPLPILHVALLEECVHQVVSALTIEINRAFVVVQEIETGKDLKKFLGIN